MFTMLSRVYQTTVLSVCIGIITGLGAAVSRTLGTPALLAAYPDKCMNSYRNTHWLRKMLLHVLRTVLVEMFPFIRE